MRHTGVGECDSQPSATNRVDRPLTLQPGPADGQDFYITSYYGLSTGSTGAGGAADEIRLRLGGWADEYRSLIQFNVASLPGAVSSAKVRLYAIASGNTAVYVDRVTSAWQWSPTFVWAQRPSFTAVAGPIPAPGAAGWYEIDITSLYNAWKDGSFPNYGLQLRPQSTSNNNFCEFYSSNYTDDPSFRPQLVITP